MSAPLKDRTYIVGRERRRRAQATGRERRSQHSARSQRYLPIQHRSVSRRHAEVIVLNGTIYLRDLGSKNGTFLVDENRTDKRPLREGYVQPGQLVMFGDCVRRIGDLLRARQAEEGPEGPAAPEPRGPVRR